ncbi:hypothetical protein ACCO45_005045 [Purpureocillium lilacinum]|uniref:Uncharacterized protein n=1 Tax=Purpureocillium lilacinum TaxID=33203 RepID=A0ACC4DV93_PURLI
MNDARRLLTQDLQAECDQFGSKAQGPRQPALNTAPSLPGQGRNPDFRTSLPSSTRLIVRTRRRRRRLGLHTMRDAVLEARARLSRSVATVSAAAGAPGALLCPPAASPRQCIAPPSTMDDGLHHD